MFKFHFSRACTLFVLVLLILVASFSGITATAKAATQDNNWTAHPLFYARPAAASGPDPLSPTQIINAYNLFSTTNGAGTTIAIVDAYDDPTIVSDLATFSSSFHLPNANLIEHKMATTINTDGGWAFEISIDVEWAHAIAPQATILLVEANSNSLTDLLAAVNYATSYPGVVAVSMSWGGSEFSNEHVYDSNFVKPGIVFFASIGDNGSGVEWPSGSPNVVSVGGTTLNLDSNGAVISETAWSGSGGGVSAYEQQPSYQTIYGLTYPNRATPDVSYDADLNTGVFVYDTTPYQGSTGWWDAGGTSVGAPQWAAIQALSQTSGDSNFYQDAKQSSPSYFRDITSGSNGYPAGPGYDLVTGLGSPITTIFSSVPGAPQHVAAVGHSSYITVTWQPPSSNGGSSITGYKVYRSNAETGTYSLIASPSGMIYDDTNLNNGQTYWYKISAINIAGEGATTSTISATPATVPDVPQRLTAIPGDSQVKLSWTVPAFNGGSDITGYNVYISTASSEEILFLGNVLAYNDSSLNNGQTYDYWVSAVNSVGEGPKSDEAVATPATLPNVPTGFMAVPGNGLIHLNWTAPSFNGGSAITGYNLYFSTSNITGFSTGIFFLDNVLTYTDASLNNGQIYDYWVSAVNSVGEGSKTSEIMATPYTVPSPPIGLQAIAGNAQVTLNWTAPSFDGGNPIDYYVVYQDGIALANHPTDTTILVTGLSNGQSYSFTVVAHNPAGKGTQSLTVQSAPFTVPNVPQGLTVAPGNAQVTLSWNVPAFNGGSNIIDYRVYRSTNEAGTFSLIASLSGLNYSDTGLTNGQTYWYKIVAVNAAGEGAMTSSASSMPFTTPNAPTGLKVIAGNSLVTLNWTAPSFDGGRVIDYYVVYQNGIMLLNYHTGIINIITGLINGQNYSFRVAACNIAGIGTQSGEVTSIPFTVPNAPTGLAALAGNAQATLNWTGPAFNGGRGIDYYVVYQNGVALSNYPTGLTDVITGLINGQSYYFTVTSHNAAGNNAQGISVTAMPMTMPGAPTGVTATPGPNKVIITWQAPLSNGGSPITGYIVYRGSQPLATVNASTMEYIDTSGTVGTIYSYHVVANNAVGTGSVSAPISASSQTDNTLIYVGIGVIAGVLVAALLVMYNRKGKK